jgi:hypothetical protein
MFLEARVGIEPTHKGFADLSLTTWVPRLNLTSIAKLRNPCQCRRASFYRIDAVAVNPTRQQATGAGFTFSLLPRFEPRAGSARTLPVAWD